MKREQLVRWKLEGESARRGGRSLVLSLALLGAGLTGLARGQTVTEFPTPTAFSSPLGIAAGPDGNLWFTEADANRIGRITTAGVITEFPVPTGGSVPRDITAGPDGNLWFTEQSGDRIGRITTGGVITEFPLPTAGSGPNGITAGPDGNLWFTEQSGNRIGRITTGGVITEFPLPTGGSGPIGIAAGPDGNLWFAEYYAGQIGRITTAGVITELPIPTSGSRPAFIAAGPDGNLWFTEEGASQIGRITTGNCVGNDTTLCLNNGRFQVSAAWRTPAGATGQGAAVRLTSDSGYFWFFNPANIEIVIKVLNACGVDGHYWVFAAGLTNVEVTLLVTDTQTGTPKTYLNGLNVAFQPVQDTSAFATCP